MAFPYRLLTLLVGICWSGFQCSAQSPADAFRWDWNASEELTGKDSISQSKALPVKESARLIEAVASELRPRTSTLDIKSEKQLLEVAAQTRIKAVDLSGKGVGEFMAQGVDELCSPTGNCEFWVLRQDGDGYSVLLHSTATQTFTIQPTLTNGFHDIVLGQHGSAFMQGLRLYRFDGSKYRRAACYEANWRISEKDDKVRELKEPKITPCKTR
jgi:hypothetical protein